MSKVLGIDVGTNSLGLTVRDEGKDSESQIIFSSVCIFPSGVDNDEFSFAAQRTKFRSKRKLYRVRRYRKWATLQLLIKDKSNSYCPLSDEELKRWMTYDKAKGLNREYPIDSVAFQQWIKLDFDGDGKPDYSSPYELRAELATNQLDFSLVENRYKLGRAMYHIAERRGFRSNKGETIKTQDTDTNTTNQDLKSSEAKRSEDLEKYKENKKLPTVGAALYDLLKQGERIRENYPPIRKQYQEEIKKIFEFQEGLDVESDLYKGLMSKKKGEGTIFYNKPLKSQKGQIGKCLLEPSKPRCPKSRPEYEEFMAWSLLNNIRFGEGCQQQLTLEQKCKMYNTLFVRASDIHFEEIRNWIETENKAKAEYAYDEDKKKSTINYKDSVSVPVSNVSYYLKKLLGDDWKNWSYEPGTTHTNAKNRESTHSVRYTWEDVWHVCFSADDEEPLEIFSEKSHLDKKNWGKLWEKMPITYADLSLKAINNINRFLQKGMMYSDACLLAKLPDIFKEHWTEEIEDDLIKTISSLIADHRKKQAEVKVANKLIETYKALPDEDKWAVRDYDYELDDSDYKDIERVIANIYGEKTFSQMEDREGFLESIAEYYQAFFNDKKRQFIKVRNIEDEIKAFLLDNFDYLNKQNLSKLYHHSKVEYYKPSPERRVERGEGIASIKLLESPAIQSLRNPMALRVLYTLRRKVNDLLIEGIIDDSDTRVVVEVARELNNSNMRSAIKTYQECKAKENELFGKRLEEHIDKVRMLVEQHDCQTKEEANTNSKKKKTSKTDEDEWNIYFEKYKKDLLERYKHWIEQGGFCIYTGKPITITDLLQPNQFDIEHTIPRSISFDDSMSNKTLCDTNYNRNTKGNKLPSELPEEDYEKILNRILPWENRLKKLEDKIEYWKTKSRRSQTKDVKDNAIRQVHLWRMEYDYWAKKVATFKMVEYKAGFRNNQLVDTSIIAKYAMHFLKSVFRRVDVQRGEVTAEFRKIFKLKPKTRDNNYHHAIDAMVLTYIPVANKRDDILKLYYESLETPDNKKKKEIQKQIDKELENCELNIDFSKVFKQIKDTVLASQEAKCQALSFPRRRMRVRGKIVPVRDEENKIIFETNEDGTYKTDIYGHRIPKAKQWIQGASIRGSLHEDTYYGAIIPRGETNVKYVVRYPLSKFKNWEELGKAMVNKELYDKMYQQYKDTTLEKAIKQGIYMIDKKGQKVGNKIRHVRCYARVTNPLIIKEQTYASSKYYKNNYHVRNGENIAYALYENGKNRTFVCKSLFEAAKQCKQEAVSSIEALFPETHEGMNRIFTLIPGQMVILKQEGESLKELTPKEISCRLYRLKRIFDPTQGKLQLQHHLEARNDKELLLAYPKKEYGESGKNGFSKINYNNPYPRLLLSKGNQNFWIEGKDFIIKNGQVIPS